MLAIPQLKAKMAIRALTLHAAAALTGLEAGESQNPHHQNDKRRHGKHQY
jgi:hypothetical protein